MGGGGGLVPRRFGGGKFGGSKGQGMRHGMGEIGLHGGGGGGGVIRAPQRRGGGLGKGLSRQASPKRLV